MVLPESVINAASPYFLNPIGLLGLLGLIPLIIFYLVKPKPEEQIMPSMMFFMQRESSGKVSQALNKLIQNLLLLLHILIIAGLAAAMAEPYFSTLQKPEDTVIVFDRSASMSNDMKDAKQFVNSNLGKSNTLIVADNEVEIPLEDVSGSEVRRYIDGLEARDVETDISAAMENVGDYEGNVVVASDLDQTVNSRNPENQIKNLRQSREVKVYNSNDENSWGIVRVDPGEENSTVDVKNFRASAQDIGVRTDEGSSTITVEAESVRTLTVATEPGRNEVELEEDEMTADNKAFISVPEDRDFRVMYIRDQNNPYLEKVVELVEFTDLQIETPPVDSNLNADIYVVGETDRILESTATEIEEQVKKGKGLVMFGQPELRDKGFDSAPNVKQRNNETVEILQPVRANVGETEIYSLSDTKGKSLSQPKNAVRERSLGRGKVVLYNIRDEDFRQDFLYPIFWKNIFSDLVDRPEVNDLNRQTGDSVNSSALTTPSGEKKTGEINLDKSGFYNGTKLYAANMESEDESNTESVNIQSDKIADQITKKNVQNFSAVLLAVIVMLELFYLMYIGEV